MTKIGDNYKRFRKKFFFIFIVSIFLHAIICQKFLLINASYCYSCAGICHSENCNCQIGSCESDYCFSEKKPAEVAGLFRITKGCIKRPPRMRLGCDFDFFHNHIQCICKGSFCNDAIKLQHNHMLRRNITCRECSKKNFDCGKTCYGEWCHEKFMSGESGCGFGPPSLPYFYQGPELLKHKEKMCITLSRGNGNLQKYCICNTHMCNDVLKRTPSFLFSLFNFKTAPPHKSRSVTNYYENARKFKKLKQPTFYTCVNCDLTAEQNSLTSNCKLNRCYGHFCVYATQRVFVNKIGNTLNSGAAAQNSYSIATQTIIQEKQGCMNVTDTNHIQLGCTHKWINNEQEELYCACRSNMCNVDLITAAASNSLKNFNFKTVFFNLISFVFFSIILIHYI